MLSTFFHPQHVFLLEVIEWVVFQLSEIYATNCEQPNVFAHAKFVDRRFWTHPRAKLLPQSRWPLAQPLFSQFTLLVLFMIISYHFKAPEKMVRTVGGAPKHG